MYLRATNSEAWIFAALETALDSPMRSVKGLYGLLLIRKNLEEV